MIPRSDKYKAFIKDQKCCVPSCENMSDPHHVTNGGKGIKCSDYGTLNICRRHHRELHGSDPIAFQKKHHVSIPMEMFEMLHMFHTGEPFRFPQAFTGRCLND